MWRKKPSLVLAPPSCTCASVSAGTIITTTGIVGAVMVRTTGALGTEAVSVLAFAPLHCLHEMSTVFGGHQSADLLMMTVLFVTSA